MENQSIARHNLLAELHVVDLHEVSRITFGFVKTAKHEYATGLRHSLNLEHTRQHRFLREMALEERLIGSDILHTYYVVGTLFDNLVDQKERIAVRKHLADAVVIHQRLLVRIVDRSLYLLVFDFATNLLGEGSVDGVARTSGNDTTLQRTADESYIAQDVKELMACGLILRSQRYIIDIAELAHTLVGHIHQVGQTVKFSLFHRTVIDYYGILKVTTLDEIILYQRLYFTHENKCAARSYLILEIIYMFQ